jgi:thiosulfate/3-mercaptopyruvate sulfurtransferase
MTVTFFSILTLFAMIAPGHQQEAKQHSFPRADLLIQAKELMKPHDARNQRILDVRARNDYQAGHIPGAVWVDPADWGKASCSEQDRAAWTRRIGSVGIDTSTKVVVYDNGGTPEAARVWWILRFWGIPEVRLLDGGYSGWRADDGTASQAESAYAVRKPKLLAHNDRLATKGQIMARLKENPIQIIDTRSEQEYCGEAGNANRKGAIPGAIHVEWSDLVDKKSKRFKSPEELSKLFEEKGIDLKKPTVTHCQSGGRASVMALGLELMGAKQIRNYYKSWAEWGNAEDTPIVKPKK